LTSKYGFSSSISIFLNEAFHTFDIVLFVITIDTVIPILFINQIGFNFLACNQIGNNCFVA
jgi:hypothetical protein